MDNRWLKTAASVAEHRILELTAQFTNMSNVKTIHVPHLGGIDAGYQMPRPYDASKPTLVMVNSFTTDSNLYRSQFANEELNKSMNLIAIELLGHGKTRAKCEHFTVCLSIFSRYLTVWLTCWFQYWDTAIMNLQVLEALGLSGSGKKAFVLGTSQGGWITVRMALLAPEKITGIINLGTSMDYESERTRKLGCWNAPELMAPTLDEWTSSSPTPDFAPSEGFANFLVDSGFGADCPGKTREFWVLQTIANYQGDDGRRRARMAALNLRDRDGLHGRLSDVRCPVLWMHGTSDIVYSVANAQEEIKLFVNSPDAQVKVVEGGQHFLSFSHPKEVDAAVVEFVGEYGK